MLRQSSGPPGTQPSSSVLPLVVILLALAVGPLSLRVVNALADTHGRNRSYVPSIESRPTRRSFDPGPIDSLRHANPEWVFIGDSMLGTRIHTQLLSELSERGNRTVMLLLQPASGPAWWYLAFKNHLVASGVKPRATFFFFRDTNLTETMFRLRNQLGEGLDEVARDVEPELDAIAAARERGLWWRVDAAFERVYEVNEAYTWLHPTLRRWYALWKYPDPRARLNFESAIEEDFNSNFRRDLAADIGKVSDDVDFNRDLPTSVLPLIMGLAKSHGLPVCFVRVQRRPVGNQPPPQSPALQQYIADFRAWAAAEGASFHDETGDPELTVDLYEDGDHVADRLRYTRIFRKRLDPLLR